MIRSLFFLLGPFLLGSACFLLVVLGLTGCPSLGSSGGDLQAVRDDLRVYRQAIEPTIEALVLLEDDPGKLERFRRAQAAADAVGATFDAYLKSGSGEDRASLVYALNAVLTAVEGIVPILDAEGDPLKRQRAILLIGLARVLVVTTAARLDEPELALLAASAP